MHGKSRIPLQEGAFRLIGGVFPTRFEALFWRDETQLVIGWPKKNTVVRTVFFSSLRDRSHTAASA